MRKCLKPFTLKNRPDLFLPCGNCVDCRARRASSWAFRLTKEYEKAQEAYFVTYTYSSPPMSVKGFMTLSKRDFQLYMKRLRKSAGQGLKYYVAGEYGPKSLRPHYHALMFNCPLNHIIGQENARKANAWPLYYLDGKFQFEDKHWQNGHITVGLITGASVAYTLKYISKPTRIPMWPGDDRVKEFSLMSKGLGANYLTPQAKAWHKADINNRLYCTLPDGRKITMPRYYKKHIYSSVEMENIGLYVKQKQYEDMANMNEDQRKKYLLQFNNERNNIVELNRKGKKSLVKYTI